MERSDRLMQGMALNGGFRILGAQTTQTVEEARSILDLSPVAADALGRTMTAAILLARLLEKSVRQQRVTLRFEGNGPLGVVIGEGTVQGHARGYVSNPRPEGENLDVSHAVGDSGILTVVRGTPPEGRPYTSQVALEGGGVAKEVSRYLVQSEQIASAVMLGVLNRRSGVAAAGGIVVQAFPHTSDEAIALVETRIQEAPPLSTLLDRMSIEDAVRTVFDGLDYKPVDPSFNVPLSYRCSCSRERALAPLALFEPGELEEMIREDGGTEVVCQFCGRKYNFSAEELLTLTAVHDA
ncbi:MAG TPA: Hsp33 family molecular chaperone HslO [Thermoanaerobaculia bacterium]|nr:Hsp33 family molecular chaperone HslO [Thermoanaerobaculia bacterium]